MTAAASQSQVCTRTDIEHALLPGTFIPASDMPAFVSRVRALHSRLAAMARAGHASKAVKLYEVFLAACVNKASELTDPQRLLSEAFRSLFCGWIRARQKAGLSPKETVRQVVQWQICMEHNQFEVPVDMVAKALDRRGYSLFADHYLQMLDHSLKRWQSVNQEPGKCPPDHVLWPAVALSAIYDIRGDIQAYTILTQLVGLKADDCHRLASMAERQQNIELALDWIERGVELDRDASREKRLGHLLTDDQLSLLIKLGRIDEARALAWSRFRETRSITDYRELMRLAPEDQRSAWHHKAMFLSSTEKWSSLDLLAHCKEWRRLADRIKQSAENDVSVFGARLPEHTWASLAKADATAAAKLHVAVAFRILGQDLGTDHTHTLCHLKEARDLFRQVGDQDGWAAVVKRVEELPRDPQNVKSRFAQIVAWERGDGRLQFFREAQSIWHGIVDPEVTV